LVLTKYLYIIVTTHEGDFRITKEGLKEMVEKEGFELDGEVLYERRALHAKFKKI
jgi:hypothetical protein